MSGTDATATVQDRWTTTDSWNLVSLLQEIMPTRHRSKASYVAFNFINLGGIILGGIAMAAVSTSVQRGTLAGAVIVVLFVLFIARNRTPESIRWLHRRGRPEDAEREAEKYFGTELWAARAREADRRQAREDSARPPRRSSSSRRCRASSRASSASTRITSAARSCC